MDELAYACWERRPCSGYLGRVIKEGTGQSGLLSGKMLFLADMSSAARQEAINIINDLLLKPNDTDIFRGQGKGHIEWPLLPKALRKEFKD